MKHVNHYKLEKGIYLADTPVNNLWVLDVRVVKPNSKEKLMKPKAIHTAEHIASNNKPLYIDGKEGWWRVVSINPMGCRTGFYVELFGNGTKEQASEIIKLLFTPKNRTEIPFSTPSECGAYKEHDLEEGLKICDAIIEISKNGIKNYN